MSSLVRGLRRDASPELFPNAAYRRDRSSCRSLQRVMFMSSTVHRISLPPAVTRKPGTAAYGLYTTTLPYRIQHGLARSKATSAKPEPPAESPAETESAPSKAGARPSLLKLSPRRENEIGIQQLSTLLHDQLFLDKSKLKPPSKEAVAVSKSHLSEQKLLGTADDSGSPPIGFDLPKLQGKSLAEHFSRLGKHFSGPYKKIAQAYVDAQVPPKPPAASWVTDRPGWVKYMPDGTAVPVAYPNEDALTFDVETLWKISPFPILATAASSKAWYSWVSPWVLGLTESKTQLIPLGNPEKNKVVVGHNVGYDRARVLEEYDLNQTRSFFIDTMSLHVAVNGMCSRQRPLWMKHRKARQARSAASDEAAAASEEDVGKPGLVNPLELGLDLDSTISGNWDSVSEEKWVDLSSANSLADVARFHCGISLNKTVRDSLAVLSREEAAADLRNLIDYCSDDVVVTHKVYQKVFPAFLETCPHPVSFNALRHLSSVILPVNKTWEHYIHTAESVYQEREDQIKSHLISLAREALKLKDDKYAYESDPWLSQLDWSGQEIRMVKGKKKGDPPRPAARQKAPGMPKWWKDLLPTAKDTEPVLTLRTRVAALLMKLTWEGYPLFWSDTYGFMYRVPKPEVGARRGLGLTPLNMSEDEDARFKADTAHSYFKLPHKDGPTARCTNPLSKGYLGYFEKGVMQGTGGGAKEIVELSSSCSYWVSSRERIRGQVVVYKSEVDELKRQLAYATEVPKPGRRPSYKPGKVTNREDVPTDPTKVDPAEYGYILPQIIPMGTITRRAVENTWLTASNAKPNRVGSELKSMVRAPPGFTFVGADVDSEELWIACLLGDSQFGFHGASALGYMTLVGSKNAGTDLHSRTAKILGISRDAAKVFNYGRIYGAGVKFATTLLKQFSPSITDEEADQTAKKLYAETKGRRTTRTLLHNGPFWRAGSESVVFNMLEQFASTANPRTPVLGAGLTEALKADNVGKGGFLTSRVNWAIQSSGVDYLHLLITSMEWLCLRYSIPARLSISIHDEIRYIVPEADRYRTALALQVANLWVRSFFAESVGIMDLPLCVAFFSAVDVDKILRKEVFMDCVTPSQRVPLPPGESLDIDTLLDLGHALDLPAPSAEGSAAAAANGGDDGSTEPSAPLPPMVARLLEDQVMKARPAEPSGTARVSPTQLILESKNPVVQRAFLHAQLASADSELTEVVRQARRELQQAIAERRAAASTKAKAGSLISLKAQYNRQAVRVRDEKTAAAATKQKPASSTEPAAAAAATAARKGNGPVAATCASASVGQAATVTAATKAALPDWQYLLNVWQSPVPLPATGTASAAESAAAVRGRGVEDSVTIGTKPTGPARPARPTPTVSSGLEAFAREARGSGRGSRGRGPSAPRPAPGFVSFAPPTDVMPFAVGDFCEPPLTEMPQTVLQMYPPETMKR